MSSPGGPQLSETGHERPRAAVIVPFVGSQGDLRRVVDTLSTLHTRAGDELIVADNRRAPRPLDTAPGPVRWHPAQGLAAAGFARNVASRDTTADWLVFVDSDTIPSPGLLDSYLHPPPNPATGVLAGAITDAASASASGSLASRYVVARRTMDQQITLERRGSPYAQSANCAVRRVAFEQAGGFDERIRWGEDADLCFRLARLGWTIEARPGASVLHEAPATLLALLAKLSGHGAGAAWCDTHHPGEFPPPTARSLGGRLYHHLTAAAGALRRGHGEQAAFAVVNLLADCAYEAGRLRPNTPRAHRTAP